MLNLKQIVKYKTLNHMYNIKNKKSPHNIQLTYNINKSKYLLRKVKKF